MTSPRRFIQAARFSPDGLRLLTGSIEGGLAVWDVASGKRLRWLLDPAGDEDSGNKLSKGEEKAREASFPDGHPDWSICGYSLMSVCFSPDGRRAYAVAGNSMIGAWDANSGAALSAWRAHDEEAIVLEASPDGRWLASGCRQAGAITLRVWKVAEDPLAPAAEAFSSERMVGGVFALAFSADSRLLASGGWGNSGYSAPMIYDLATGERIGTLLYDASRAICFSPDGKRLATGDEFGKVSIWDLASRVRIWENNAHASIVSVVRFSPDGGLLASGSCDGEVILWDADKGIRQNEQSYSGLVLDCRFTPAKGVLIIAVGCPGAEKPGIYQMPVR